MIRILLTLILLANVSVLCAQEPKRIHGKVIDEVTSEPLAFAHIGIFDSSYGTISNVSGEFSIIIPTKFSQANLSASYLGYETKSISIPSINDQELVIKLKSTATELPEIVIRSNKKSIIEEAIEAIPKNHDQNEMLLRAFWRASIWNQTSNYIQMTEYAFDMYRYGNHGEEENAIKILRGRIARDSSFFEDLHGMQIGITPTTLFTNSLLKGHPILDDKIIKKHTYNITDATTYNGRAVFIVSFKPKEKASGKLYEGKILLDTESLAFVKISFRKLISESNPERVFDSFSLAALGLGLGKSTMNKYENELNYQLVGDRWYLSHAKYDIDWTMRRTKGNVSKPVTFKADFVVTNIEKQDIVVPPAEQLASKSILEQQVVENEDQFWREYNYLKADRDFEKSYKEILNRK